VPTKTEAWKAITKVVNPNEQDPDFIDELSENLILVAEKTIPTAQCRQCRDPSGVKIPCGNTLVGEITLTLHVAQKTLIESTETEQVAIKLSEASVPFDQGFQFALFHRTNSQYYTAMRWEKRLDI